MKTMQSKRSLVFDHNDVPFAMCHASNCCLLPNGNVLIAWFAGSHEGADDTAIWMTCLGDGGFSPVRVAANDGEVPHWNPVFFVENENRIWLLYKTGREINSWTTYIRYSNDSGKTWSEPRELVQGDRGGRGPVRTKMISLENGVMLAGGSVEKGIWHSFVDQTENKGKTWVKSKPIAIAGLTYAGEKTASSEIAVSEQSFYGRGIIQPSLWESGSGHVHMLMRSSEGNLFRADSSDYGTTWSNPVATSFPNNNSGMDVVTLSSGDLVLCSNPVGVNWGPRTPLCLHRSKDNGETWERLLTLEDDEGEYAYPSIARKGTTVCVSYTWNRKAIAVWQFDEKEWEE